MHYVFNYKITLLMIFKLFLITLVYAVYCEHTHLLLSCLLLLLTDPSISFPHAFRAYCFVQVCAASHSYYMLMMTLAMSYPEDSVFFRTPPVLQLLLFCQPLFHNVPWVLEDCYRCPV